MSKPITTHRLGKDGQVRGNCYGQGYTIQWGPECTPKDVLEGVRRRLDFENGADEGARSTPQVREAIANINRAIAALDEE